MSARLVCMTGCLRVLARQTVAPRHADAWLRCRWRAFDSLRALRPSGGRPGRRNRRSNRTQELPETKRATAARRPQRAKNDITVVFTRFLASVYKRRPAARSRRSVGGPLLRSRPARPCPESAALCRCYGASGEIVAPSALRNANPRLLKRELRRVEDVGSQSVDLRGHDLFEKRLDLRLDLGRLALHPRA